MSLDPAVAACRLGVRRTLAACDPGATILVACSGGADSLALLAAAVFEARALGQRIVGVTVDHGLQDSSAEVAAQVVEQMRALGADETVSVRVTVDAPGIGPEAAARQARYEVLEQVAASSEAVAVLLGHTLDDQAETVLMGLSRGSGARSLQGMRRSFDRFARPLLDVTRAQTELACLADGIQWWVDPHNSDPAYLRSQVRMEVMPLLETVLGPGVAAALARTADQVQTDVAYLDAVAADVFEQLSGKSDRRLGGTPSRRLSSERSSRVETTTLSVEALAELPPAIRRRVIRLAALAAGATDAELFYDHVLSVEALVTDWRGQKWIDLPGRVRARRTGELLVWESQPAGL